MVANAKLGPETSSNASSIKPGMMGAATTPLITAVVNQPASKSNGMTGCDPDPEC
ncbi:MAG: hypothetical protein ACYCZ6_03415 [Polaromonas sp.]